MGGIDGEHEPVEEAPPLRRRPREEPVHRRDQPDERDILGERARALVLAGDADATRRLTSSRVARMGASADLDLAARGTSTRAATGEAAGAVFAGKARHRAAPRRPRPGQQRDGFEQVGLARAVLAGQHDRPRVELELGAA